MPRVLVVDDEANHARVIAIGLRIEGFDVETAVNADGALRMLEAQDFDLAVVDLMMPGTNGIQLARLLRERYPHTRVVLTSAYHLSERQLIRADCGAVAFVPKPFDVTDLARFLRAKLGAESGPFETRGRLPMDRRAIVPAPLPAWRHPGSVDFLRVEAFHYELPPELIAQRPLKDRELARLLSVPIGGGTLEHRRVCDLPELIPKAALVVVNDTRVIPARLLGRKRDTGGRAEVLLVRQMGTRPIEVTRGVVREAQIWRALGKSSKPLKFGADIEVSPRRPEAAPAALFVRLVGRGEDDGLLEVALWTPSGEEVDAAVRVCGHVPLPPYIERDDAPEDIDRYQTVYARHEGAIAAPTAGLHLTNATLERLAARGCEVASVTLHVGLGTFQPVRVDDFDRHSMHAEKYAVTQSTADAIERARARGAPVVAIGTTTARALESAADPQRLGQVQATVGDTRLLIQPGYRWRVVDGLLTNFHLPRSTLLALVGAFAGLERVLDAYRLAIRERYRFFSYGDAMLLWRDV